MLDVSQAYERFLGSLVPTTREREAAVSHRASVEGALRSGLSVGVIRETGSFNHGTGVRGHSDVDIMASLTSLQPQSSDTALANVRSALQSRYPYTEIKVRRPAVVIEFAAKSERWEVIPAYRSHQTAAGYDVYEIPGPATGWMQSAPRAHLDYVTASNQGTGTAGGAKKLARLLKAWKYYCGVPISSFYLEMRAAEHVRTQTSFIPIWDMSQVLTKLSFHDLADMNDPMKIAGRIKSCSSEANKSTALSRLSTAESRARKALSADNSGREADTFYYLDLLYNRRFRSRYKY